MRNSGIGSWVRLVRLGRLVACVGVGEVGAVLVDAGLEVGFGLLGGIETLENGRETGGGHDPNFGNRELSGIDIIALNFFLTVLNKFIMP